MSKGEETPNRKPSLSKICLLVLNLCFIVFTLCDMPMCVHYLQQLFSSKVLFRNFFKVVSPLSLANSFLSSMSKAAAQFPFKLFLHKICISFTTHTFLKWNHIKNCPLCEVCVTFSKVRILLFEAKQKVIPSDSSRQMGPRPRPYTYFQQIYNLSILGNPGCS